jgi:hypothetical protein
MKGRRASRHALARRHAELCRSAPRAARTARLLRVLCKDERFDERARLPRPNEAHK